MLYLFELAVTKYNPDFVARIDDDAFVNIPVVMHLLAKNFSDRPWWFGCALCGLLLLLLCVHCNAILKLMLLENPRIHAVASSLLYS